MTAYQIVKYAGLSLPPAYFAFVMSKWKRSLRYGNDYFRLADPTAYYTAYSLYLDRLLGGPSVAIRVAVLADAPDVLLGFSVSRPGILDYVFVQKDFRRIGIGANLIPDDAKAFTHVTKTWLTVWANKYPKLKFNPFA